MAHNSSSRKSGFGNYSHTQNKIGAGAGRTLRDRARREFAQNFLVDRHAVEMIVNIADPHGTVLEPGAGDGVITRALAGQPFAVVGNIPFSATAGIVDWCLRAPDLTSATLVTQLEYARKRTGDYGRWTLVTVSTWPWFSWELANQLLSTCQ